MALYILLSVLSLAGGALLGVSLHGALRFLAVASGFGGYVFLFGRAVEAFLRATP